MAKIWHKIKKHKILFSLVFILIAFVGFSFPLLSSAAVGIDDAIFIVLGWILALFLVFLQLLLYLAGMILDLVLSHALQVQETDMVTYGWALARDVANMFFIIFLLVIAFATIFRIEAYQYKALLPKLILGILLVNFSRTIATIFIEFSNLLTAAFLNFDKAGKISSSALLALMGVSDIFDIPKQMGINIWVTHDFAMVVSLAGIVFIVGILVVAIAGFAGMLVTRTINLLVLIVFSPLAFALGILPVTKKVFDEWWENFLKYILYCPLAAFALYLAMKVGSQMNVGKPVGLGSGLQGKASEATAEAAMKSIGSFGFASSAEGFYGFCLVVGLLLFSIVTIQKIGGVLAGFMIGAAKGGMLFAAKGVGKRIDRAIARAPESRLARAAKAGAKRLGFGSEKWGGRFGKWTESLFKGARLLSPTVFKEGWKQRQAVLDDRAYGESSGYAHEMFNKFPLFFDKDRLPYGQIAKSESVAKEMERFRAANPKNDYAEYVRMFADAVDKNAPSDVIEALWNLLAENDNPNEFWSRIKQRPNWGKKGGLQEKLFSRKWLEENQAMFNRGEMSMNVQDTDIPMLTHLLGGERARFCAQRFAGIDLARDKRMGGYVGATDVDWKTGGSRWRAKVKTTGAQATDEDIANLSPNEIDWQEMDEEQAGQGDKMTADKFNRQSRFCYVKLITDSKGNERSAGLTGGFRTFLEKRGGSVNRETVGRMDREFAGLTADRLREVISQIEEAIEKNQDPVRRSFLKQWLDKIEARGARVRPNPTQT
ncbi:MAG: hypothetical protein AB1465_02555 [Patescibacteria group bacterium]